MKSIPSCGLSAASLLTLFLIPSHPVVGQDLAGGQDTTVQQAPGPPTETAETPALSPNEPPGLADLTAQLMQEPSAGADDTVRFYFQGTPWRDVIEWLAEQSDLALHISDLPTGSFTYTDPNAFTVDEAVDRVNLFLLPQGFTLVRSNGLLSVINLGDPRSMQQLDVIAKLIPIEQLDQQSAHDVVKCIFPLGELKAEDAIQELSALNLMRTPSLFERTKRLLVTDTVEKLRSVREILSAFQPDTLDNGTVRSQLQPPARGSRRCANCRPTSLGSGNRRDDRHRR